MLKLSCTPFEKGYEHSVVEIPAWEDGRQSKKPPLWSLWGRRQTAGQLRVIRIRVAHRLAAEGSEGCNFSIDGTLGAQRKLLGNCAESAMPTHRLRTETETRGRCAPSTREFGDDAKVSGWPAGVVACRGGLARFE